MQAADENTNNYGKGLNRIYNSFVYDYLYPNPSRGLYVDGKDFIQIGEAFEQDHIVSKVQLGHATLRLMRQREIVDFAVQWIELNRK